MYSAPWLKWQRTRSPSMSAADERLEDLKQHLESARQAGCYSRREIAAYLNSNGFCTTRGRPWGPSQVHRAMQRLSQQNVRISSKSGVFSSNEIARHVAQARQEGYDSLREIAGYLNLRGVLTSRGLEWYPTSVSRMLRRLERDGHCTPD